MMRVVPALSISPRLSSVPALKVVLVPDISPLALFVTTLPFTFKVWPASSLPLLVRLPVVP